MGMAGGILPERGLVIRVIMEERIPGGTEGNELEVYRLQKEEIS